MPGLSGSMGGRSTQVGVAWRCLTQLEAMQRKEARANPTASANRHRSRPSRSIHELLARARAADPRVDHALVAGTSDRPLPRRTSRTALQPVAWLQSTDQADQPSTLAEDHASRNACVTSSRLSFLPTFSRSDLMRYPVTLALAMMLLVPHAASARGPGDGDQAGQGGCSRQPPPPGDPGGPGSDAPSQPPDGGPGPAPQGGGGPGSGAGEPPGGASGANGDCPPPPPPPPRNE